VGFCGGRLAEELRLPAQDTQLDPAIPSKICAAILLRAIMRTSTYRSKLSCARFNKIIIFEIRLN